MPVCWSAKRTRPQGLRGRARWVPAGRRPPCDAQSAAAASRRAPRARPCRSRSRTTRRARAPGRCSRPVSSCTRVQPRSRARSSAAATSARPRPLPRARSRTNTSSMHAVVATGPDGVAVAQLADPVRRVAGQQELGVRVGQQAAHAGECAARRRLGPSDPVAELHEQLGHRVGVVGVGEPGRGHAASILSGRFPSGERRRSGRAHRGPFRSRGGHRLRDARSPSPTRRAARSATAGSTSRSSWATCPSRRSGGCSWTAPTSRACRPRSRTRSAVRTGDPRVDLQAALAMLGPEWGLGS